MAVIKEWCENQVGNRGISFLKTLAYAFQVSLYSFLIAYLILLHHNDNLLFSRVSGTSGHTLVWVMVLLFALYIRLKLTRKRLWNVVLSFTSVLLVMSMIEGIFQLFYIDSIERFQLTAMSRIEVLVGLTVAVLTKSYKLFDKYRFLNAFAIFFTFIVFWYIGGMNVTVDGLPTEYFYDPLTNIFELVQWGFGLVSFGYAFGEP